MTYDQMVKSLRLTPTEETQLKLFLTDFSREMLRGIKLDLEISFDDTLAELDKAFLSEAGEAVTKLMGK